MVVPVGMCLDPQCRNQPVYNGKPILKNEVWSTNPREESHLRFKNTDFISKKFIQFSVQKQLSS